MSLLRLLPAGAAALFVAACVALPPAPADDAPLGPALSVLGVHGRIALRQGERRDHLRFRWDHAPGRDAVLLMSPLGQGLAELVRDAAGARLVRPGEPTQTAASLPELAHRVLGVPLPLEELADWLRGARPALGGEIDGWRVEIGDVAPYRQRRLPRVLEARRGDVDLKLIVDEWESPE